MPSNAKRKWNLDSKTFFGSRGSNKVLVVEDTSPENLCEAFVHQKAVDVSLSNVSTEESEGRSRMARIRRSGSKFLSIVGLQRTSGMALTCVDIQH